MPLNRQRQRSETAAAPQAPQQGPGAEGTRSRIRQRPLGTETTSVTRVNNLEKTETDLVNEVIKHPVALDGCQHPAYLRVSGGATLNMGNYESVRVDVSLEWPFPPTEEALEAVYDWATTTVDAKVQHEIAVAKGEAESSATGCTERSHERRPAPHAHPHADRSPARTDRGQRTDRTRSHHAPDHQAHGVERHP